MSFEPKSPQRAPYLRDETAGEKKAWCSCGLSENQPFCDGSHSREKTGMSPTVVTVEKTGKVAWCGCKHSKNKPYCDGSHSKM